MKTPAPLPLIPLKALNLVANALLAVALLAGLAFMGAWALTHPVFALGGITIQGDVQRNNEITLRANVAPYLSGNFFTLNVDSVRGAFEATPWVRTAQVRREFPNRLRVVLQEHEAVAYWGSEGESRLVNRFGEVFEANPGDGAADDLPRLVGPNRQSAQVLAMHRALAGPLALLDAEIDQLELTPQGNWRAQLGSGAVIELGRGSADEVLLRLARFTRTLTQVVSAHQRRATDLLSADLRHGDGYALRLRGVSTGLPAAPSKPGAKPGTKPDAKRA